MPGHHGSSGTSMGVSQGNSHSTSGNDNNYQDRIQRVASGIEPGHRPTDSRPHGLAPEEAYRQGKITKDEMNQAINNPGIDTDGNYQEKIGFWDQVKNVASEYIESAGLIGNVVKLGGKVLSKLGEYSSDLQKKAMTYSLNNKITSIGKKDDFHPGAYGYKIQDIQKDIDAINKGDFKQSDFNEKYGSPEINVGGENDRDIMNMVTPIAPHIVGGTTPVESQAAKWFSNLGGNQGGFNLTQAYADAKTKQASILGQPSPMKYLAVSQSPFFEFLKENKLNKGIL